jgi:hypothetical protein
MHDNDLEWRAAREGVLALYRAHLHGRQLSLSLARRIVQMHWYGWADAERGDIVRAAFARSRPPKPARSSASPRRAIEAIETFYAVHQPFQSDRTVYVRPSEDGAVADRARCAPWSSLMTAPCIDRLAWTAQGWVMHLYVPLVSWPRRWRPVLPREAASIGAEAPMSLAAESDGAVSIVVHDLLAGACARRGMFLPEAGPDSSRHASKEGVRGVPNCPKREG